MTISSLNDIKQLPSPSLGFLPAIHDAVVDNTPLKFSSLDPQWAVLEYGVKGNFPEIGAPKKFYVDLSQDKIYWYARPDPSVEVFEYMEIVEADWGGAAIARVPRHATPSTVAGRVFKNQTAAAISIPPYQSWPARSISPGQFYGCDGRMYYRVNNKTGTNSYYPHAFERVVYSVAFSNKSLPVGDVFELSRLFYFRCIGNNTPVVYSVIFEAGYRVDETDPAPVGPNLGRFVWLPPLLEQQVFITDIKSMHPLGVFFRRAPEKTSRSSNEPACLEADALYYNKATPVPLNSLPDKMDFMLRVRLSQFDTDSDEKDPRGFVAYTVRGVSDPEDQ